MNQEQFLGILRALLPAILAYAVGAGWIDAGSVGPISAAVVALAAAGWSIWVHTKANQVASVAAFPEVKSVTVEPTTAGRALATAAGSSPTAIVNVGTVDSTPPKRGPMA